jgi:hypothetical protein
LDPEPSKVDLESHCLSALLRRRGLLAQVNRALLDHQLDQVRGQDFQDAGTRAIFEAWKALLENDAAAPREALSAQVPPDLQPKLAEMLVTDDPRMADEQLIRDIVMTLLRLRERNLKHLGQQLRFLTLEAQEAGDLRARQYVEALRTYQQTLLRTQQALANRWSWVG